MNKSQRNAMQLHMYIKMSQDKDTNMGHTYNLQSISIWMLLQIVSSIPICKIWHHNEWLFIQNICTKEFYQYHALIRQIYKTRFLVLNSRRMWGCRTFDHI